MKRLVLLALATLVLVPGALARDVGGAPVIKYKDDQFGAILATTNKKALYYWNVEKRAGGKFQRGAGAAALADLGVHPEDGAPVKVLSGRFGPYIKHGATNANVPKGREPASLTLEEAVVLLAERVAKGGGKKPVKKAAAKKAPAAKKAAPAKKPAAKKPAAKKPAVKKAKV